MTLSLVPRKQTCYLPITVLPANLSGSSGGVGRASLSLLDGNFLEFLQQVLIQTSYVLDSGQVLNVILNFFLCVSCIYFCPTELCIAE